LDVFYKFYCLCFLLFILVTHSYKSEPFLTGKQIGGEKPEVTEEVKPAPGQMFYQINISPGGKPGGKGPGAETGSPVMGCGTLFGI
jgi:hypothetical protein